MATLTDDGEMVCRITSDGFAENVNKTKNDTRLHPMRKQKDV